VDSIRFREAKPGDAGALGTLHVASWRESYAGLLPEALLAGLSADARAALWGAVLEDPAAFGGAAVLVAESAGGIVGFGACGGQRDEALTGDGFDGEVGAVYVLRSHQRAGVGQSLMRLMARRLLDQGRRGAALWVLRENIAARAFYERLGGAVVAERKAEESGAVLTEVAYGWSDLSALVR
jgi:ribosomal protein S18 acetylase RimI-like enzyme